MERGKEEGRREEGREGRREGGAWHGVAVIFDPLTLWNRFVLIVLPRGVET